MFLSLPAELTSLIQHLLIYTQPNSLEKVNNPFTLYKRLQSLKTEPPLVLIPAKFQEFEGNFNLSEFTQRTHTVLKKELPTQVFIDFSLHEPVFKG